MTYLPPPPGWIEVQLDRATGRPRKQKLHASQSCGETEVSQARARQPENSSLDIYLSEPMPYSQFRKAKPLSRCKCGKKTWTTTYPTNDRGNPQERLQAPPGSGRRR